MIFLPSHTCDQMGEPSRELAISTEKSHNDPFRGRISVFGRVESTMVRKEQMPAAIAPEGFKTKQCFIPLRTPILARPLEATLGLPTRRLDGSAANGFASSACSPVVHAILVFAKIIEFLLHCLG